ncbi:GNAT family N-acetyltransferase [Rhizobium sp. 18055]|jgi:ribosomal protein S18 acetylase RimI-like enzyme|uniref:GNAT family N-acetyltransferase n=1 Tax=Rhizobium sp. 18055 TaxID=2681403 RepID=UPI00135A9ECC|nr:GNAT family N-acetyltransferase [Rhizobium sp. 18055]
MAITVELVEGAEAISAVQDFCRAFRSWLYERYPDDLATVDVYYNPKTFEALLARLPELHRRPQGAIFLARLDGVPVGCVMQQQNAPGIVEMKRLFVSDAARGHGVGAALCAASMAQAKADGYQTMRLDTGKHQTEAIALYRRIGFVQRGPYYETTPELVELLRFFERPL